MPTTTHRPDPADINQKMRSTANDLRDQARVVRDDARDAAATIKEDLEDLAHSAGNHAREIAGSAEKNFDNLIDVVSAKMRKQPVKYGVGALAAGVVLGLFFRRS